MNLPNKLTVFRIAVVPVFIAILLFDHGIAYLAACILFWVAGFTDYLDGRIARSQNLVTNFGKLMDPAADKILVVAALVMMITIPVLSVPAWAIVIIVSREFFVTGFRSIAADQGVVLAANNWGKAKTVIQMFYIWFFLGAAAAVELIVALQPFAPVVATASYWLGAAISIFTLMTGIQIAWANWTRLGLGDL